MPPRVRALLVILLVHGLVPGLAEVGEALVHYARTGHAAHSEADHGDLGDQGPEHGCGTTQHHCTCCTGLEVAAPGAVAIALHAGVARPVVPVESPHAAREPSRPFRPPIS